MRNSTRYERVEEVRGHKYIRLRSGRLISYYDAMEAAEYAYSDMIRAVSRAFKLVNARDVDDLERWDLERIDWFIDHLEEYIGAVRGELEKRLGGISKKERITLLRNVEGRTEEEAEAFLKKADQLEAQL